MALKAKIANKFESDDEGYVTGTIIQVLEIEEKTVVEKGKEITYAEQYEFNIESTGSIKPIVYKIWTGQKINSEKFEFNDGLKDYNKLTRFLIQVEALDEKNLIKDLKSVDVDIDKLEGTKIKFKLEKSKKTRGLSVPNIRTIKLVDKDKPSTAKAK